MTPGGRGGQLSPSPPSAQQRQDGAQTEGGQPAPLPWPPPPEGSQEPLGPAPTSQAEGSQVAAGPLCPLVASWSHWSIFWFKAPVTQLQPIKATGKESLELPGCHVEAPPG